MVVHKRFGQFVAMEYRARFADFCRRVLLTDAKQTCEAKILKDGQAVDVMVEGIAAQDRQGQERVCRAAVIDISQRKRVERVGRGRRCRGLDNFQPDKAPESSGHRGLRP